MDRERFAFDHRLLSFLDWVVSYLSSTASPGIESASSVSHILRMIVALAKRNWPLHGLKATAATSDASSSKALFTNEVRFLMPFIVRANSVSKIHSGEHSYNNVVYSTIKELLKLDGKTNEEISQVHRTNSTQKPSSFLESVILPTLVDDLLSKPYDHSTLPIDTTELSQDSTEIVNLITSDNKVLDRSITELWQNLVHPNTLKLLTSLSNGIHEEEKEGMMESSSSILYFERSLKMVHLLSILLESSAENKNVSENNKFTPLHSQLKETISGFERCLKVKDLGSVDLDDGVKTSVEELCEAMTELDVKVDAVGRGMVAAAVAENE